MYVCVNIYIYVSVYIYIYICEYIYQRNQTKVSRFSAMTSSSMLPHSLRPVALCRISCVIHRDGHTTTLKTSLKRCIHSVYLRKPIILKSFSFMCFMVCIHASMCMGVRIYIYILIYLFIWYDNMFNHVQFKIGTHPQVNRI